MSISGPWGTALAILGVLSVLEFFITNRFGLFGFGILVWRARWKSFRSGSPGESRLIAGDVYYMASPDRWLFQRRDDAFFLAALQYKGTLRRDGEGAVASVRVPLFPVAFFVAMIPAALAQPEPSPSWLWTCVLAPALLIGYGIYRGSDAAKYFL